MNDTEWMSRRALEQVILEARLLDERRYEEWLALFAEDGHYWMPLTWGQQDPWGEPSLMYEDKVLLRIRTQRLEAATAPSLQTPSRCVHVLQAPTVESVTESTCLTRCTMAYFESSGERQQQLGAIAWHHWIRVEERLLLSLKRVELLNCEAALPALQLFL